MDADQFAQFVNNTSTQEQSRRAIQSHRDTIRDLIRQTSQCDGSSTLSVRLWLKEIGLAFDQVGQLNIIQIVANTITGNLRFEVARFLSEYIIGHNTTREAVPWAQLREHLSTQFLNPDETQSLRDELDRIKQSPYDSIPQYSRKFRELADSAYAIRARNNDQELTLVRAFARGLTSNEMARKLIENIVPPVSLEAAIALVARYHQRHDAYDRLGRQEVPMEIGSLDQKGKTPEPAALDALTKQVQRLSTKLAKMETSMCMSATHEVSQNTHQQGNNGHRKADVYHTNKQRGNVPTDQSVRLCYACNQPGHFARDCRQRYDPQLANNASHYNGSGQRQGGPQQRVEMLSQPGNGQPL